MAQIIFICGKIGSGKSPYAARLRRQRKAARLSVDEITLALSAPFRPSRPEPASSKTAPERKSVQALCDTWLAINR